jgi:hypothetical protein
VRLKNGRQFLREWRLEQLPQFVKQLQATDDVAVEATHRGPTMPGPPSNYPSHAEKQLGVRGFSQFRFAGSYSVKRTFAKTTE